MAKLSTEFQRFFFDEDRDSHVTLNDIIQLAGERIFGFLFVVLSFPSALPLPAPGYSVPFGILIFVLAVQLIAGKKTPWMPHRFTRYPVQLTTLQDILKKGLPWLQRIETLTKPRLTAVCVSLPGRVVMGSAIALMGISMMIPIPGTNTLPAIGVFVTGFGLVEDDGAISLAGLLLCLAGFMLSISILLAIVFGGSSLIAILKNRL